MPDAAVTPEAIASLIIAFVREELVGEDEVDIAPDDSFLTSGWVDSVGIVRLIGHLKERLEIEVPPGDLVPENFRTIRTMATYMHGRTLARAQAS